MISIEKLLLLFVWTLRFLFRDVLRMVDVGEPGLLVGEEGDAAFDTLLVLPGEVRIEDITDEDGFMYGGILKIGNLDSTSVSLSLSAPALYLVPVR